MIITLRYVTVQCRISERIVQHTWIWNSSYCATHVLQPAPLCCRLMHLHQAFYTTIKAIICWSIEICVLWYYLGAVISRLLLSCTPGDTCYSRVTVCTHILILKALVVQYTKSIWKQKEIVISHQIVSI